MEKLTWKVIEPLFAKTDSGLSVKYSRDLSMFFNGCKSLRWCDVRKGLKVTNNTKIIEYFFSGCESLRGILGLTSWDISGITDFDYMFFNCKTYNGLIFALGILLTSKISEVCLGYALI